MASYMNFHAQLASIMEVLANAAVAEICQLVDDGFAALRLEISRSQRENLALKSTLRLMEVCSGEQSHGEPTPQMDRTCASKEQRPRRYVSISSGGEWYCSSGGNKRLLKQKHHDGEDSSTIFKIKVKSTMLENTDTQGSQLLIVTEQPVEPEVVVIKNERLEEELTGCSVLEDHQTAPNISVDAQSLCLAAESDGPLNVEAEIPRVSVSGGYDNQDFASPETQQQEEEEGVEEAGTLCRYSHPAHQSHRDGGPNTAREMTDLTKEEEKHVDSSDSPSAESHSSQVPDGETTLMVTLDSKPSPENTRVNGLCGVAADWRGEAVKLEAEPSWSEAFRTCNPLLSVPRNECVSNSTLSNTSSHHIEHETAELETTSLDSSFDDLFSSPEVARSLTGHHKHSTNGLASIEEPPPSHLTSSLPLQSSESSFGNCSTSDSPRVSSFRITSSDSRCRSFSSNTERAFSCHQCSRLFSTSRDLVVHQRSHAGERIYHCHLCRKPFVHPHQLKTHQRVHTGEKPFSCTQCGKRFSQSSHIKRHMSVHTGEKRYSCNLCGKRFSQACSLKVHQTVHTGERPYSCSKCGKSFSVLGNLVRHHSIHIGK